jgi:hypothetical protein
MAAKTNRTSPSRPSGSGARFSGNCGAGVTGSAVHAGLSGCRLALMLDTSMVRPSRLVRCSDWKTFQSPQARAVRQPVKDDHNHLFNVPFPRARARGVTCPGSTCGKLPTSGSWSLWPRRFPISSSIAFPIATRSLGVKSLRTSFSASSPSRILVTLTMRAGISSLFRMSRQDRRRRSPNSNLRSSVMPRGWHSQQLPESRLLDQVHGSTRAEFLTFASLDSWPALVDLLAAWACGGVRATGSG